MGNSQAKKREAEYSGNTSKVLSPRFQQQEEASFNIHLHGKKKLATKEKYALIPDNFTTLEQVSISAFFICSAISCFVFLWIDFVHQSMDSFYG